MASISVSQLQNEPRGRREEDPADRRIVTYILHLCLNRKFIKIQLGGQNRSIWWQGQSAMLL